jgi:hypothetical protein
MRKQLALFLVSAAILAFQVALTRFFSLAQGSHLAFMAVSLALLGAGASGTYLSLRKFVPANLTRVLTGAAVLFTLSLPGAYLAINYLPFDAYRIAWEQLQLVWLVLYYLALSVPFFFGGVVIGAALVAEPARAGATYAANLLGSGLGPPLALLSLAMVGGPGTVFLCALLAWLAVVVLGSRWPATSPKKEETGRSSIWTLHHPLWLTLYTLITFGLIYLMLWPPALFSVRLTPYKALSQARLYPGSEIVFQAWNAFSRVDVLSSPGIRSAPGLSFAYPGSLPPQLGLSIDGDNLVPISKPTEPELTHYLPLTLAFELRPGADALILEPGGGLAVLAALNAKNSPRSITVVHSNPTVAEAIQEEFAEFSGQLYNQPRVTVIVDEPRSFLRRTGQEFSLILMPLTDSFRPVTAGAYTLNEDYRYTVEAFTDALAHLTPNGLLMVERWLQLPPSESLRVWGTMVEAGRRSDHITTDPAAHLLALRSLQTSLLGASRSPLTAAEIATVRQFATELQFDPVWLPDIQPAEINRFSVVPDAPYYQTFSNLLTTPTPDAFYADYAYAVEPPTDDHPYFFHFFKWQQTPQILQALGKTWQPFGGSGYLVLVVLLILVLILSVGLILLPLVVTTAGGEAAAAAEIQGDGPTDHQPAAPKSSDKKLLISYLLYFTLLGLGFLFVEIPLLQRFILYLGQPAYAFAVVVSAILVAAGVGSGWLSTRIPLRIALPLITVLAVLYPFLLTPLFEATLQLPFFIRILVTVAALFPLGMLVGVPFPRGMALVGQTAPELTPWVWAVNGCASVISAVLAAMIALTWSFSVVLWSAAAAYALAGLVIGRIERRADL